MKNRSNEPDIQHKTPDYIPAITTVAMPLLFGKRKNLQTTTELLQEEPFKPKPKPKAFAVAKYEISDNLVKFFDAKGFPKKRWILVREIPLGEITRVESFGNELRITWNGAVCQFVFKKKTESFSALRDQIKGLLEEQQKVVESSDKTGLTKSDFAGLINGSIGIVDLSFDILMGLHAKRVNWARLEACVDKLGGGWDFIGQTMVPLNLDFSKISAAVKRQVPKETSKEIFAVLKSIYGYFEDLKPEGVLKESALNVQNVKAVILAYYTLNDLCFGKVIGEKDSQKESLAFEGVLLGLANESNVKVNFGELRIKMDKLGVEVAYESVVEESRSIFKDSIEAALRV